MRVFPMTTSPPIVEDEVRVVRYGSDATAAATEAPTIGLARGSSVSGGPTGFATHATIITTTTTQVKERPAMTRSMGMKRKGKGKDLVRWEQTRKGSLMN